MYIICSFYTVAHMYIAIYMVIYKVYVRDKVRPYLFEKLLLRPNRLTFYTNPNSHNRSHVICFCCKGAGRKVFISHLSNMATN